MKFRHLLYFLLIAPCLCLAAAGDPTTLNFKPPDSDISVILLSNIFGIVGDLLHGSGSQIMGEMFKIFNASVLTIGGILLFYILIVSTLNTSAEGEFMGKKWKSIWIPIRAVIGIILLIPQGSGYCLAQIIVMWVVLQGIGAGNLVWNASLDYLSRGGIIVAPNIDTTKGAPEVDQQSVDAVSNMAGSMLGNIVCLHYAETGFNAINQIINKLQGKSPGEVHLTRNVDFPAAEANALLKKDTNLRSIEFPTADIWGIPGTRGMCGKVTWSAVEQLPSSFLTPDARTQWGDLSNQWENNLLGQNSKFFEDWKNGIYDENQPPPYLSSRESEATWVKFIQDLRAGNKPVPPPPSYLTSPQSQTMWRQFMSDWRAGTRSAPPEVPYQASPAAMESAQVSRATALQGMFNTLDIIAGPIVSNSLQATPQPLGYLRGSDWVTGILPPSSIKDAGVVYLARMRETLSLFSTQAAEIAFMKQARIDGWIMAGSYFNGLAKINRALVNAKSEVGKVTIDPPSFSKTVKDSISAIATNQGIAEASIKSGLDVLDNFVGKLNTSQSSLDFCKGGQFNALLCYVASSKSYAPIRSNVNPALQKYEFTFEAVSTAPGIDLEDCGSLDLGCKIRNWFVSVLNNIAYGLKTAYNKTINAIFYPLMGIYNGFFELFNKPGNPIISISMAGSQLVNVTAAMWAGGALATLFFGSLPIFGSAILGFIMFILPIYTIIMVILLTAGITCGYYIPMVPYLYFTFASIGWIIAVIESMVAAPLVALGFAHPEGHETFGKAEPTIMLLLNVFLRPAMMIVGFITAIILSYISLWLLNQAFTRVAVDVFTNTSSIASLFVPLAAIGIYVTTLLIVVQKSFSLIYDIPDKILRWLSGGQQASFGAESAQMIQEVKGAVASGASAAAQQFGENVAKPTITKAGEAAGKIRGGAEKARKGEGPTETVSQSEGGGGSEISGGGAENEAAIQVADQAAPAGGLPPGSASAAMAAKKGAGGGGAGKPPKK